MEQNNADPLFELQVDHESRTHFKDAGRWSNFVAVIYIICFGLLILVFLLAGAALLGTTGADSNAPELQQLQVNRNMIFFRGISIIVYLIYAGLMLLRFATYAKRGVEMQDQQSFNHGLKGLRNYFIAAGIFAALNLIIQAYQIIELL